MDRIIEVKVCGNHLTKDSNNAGTKGEGNITRLRITFDENWEAFAKQVIFWDAYGQNPVRVVLTVQMIEDISKSTRVYLVPIPHEAMARAGWLTFSIQGSLDNKNQVSISSTLEVNDSPDILEPIIPTPSPVEQVQAEIESIKTGIQNIDTAHRESVESAKIAKESADKAVATVGKASYIGENGNWYAWDVEKSEFYDTGVKAQAGSMVCVGTNPIDGADVWINTGEGNVLYIKNENGELIPIPTIAGKDGKGAYELAVENGYNGSMEQFITLLNNLTYTIEAEHMSDTNNPHKVTAQQVGALPIEGGTITGNEILLGAGLARVAGGQDYVQLDVFDNVKDSANRRKLVLNGGNKTTVDKSLIISSTKDGKEEVFTIYGTHNKPKASDVGAVPTAGGTMTGTLTIDKNTSWGQIILRTPSDFYRAFETDDARVRIDVRDDQLTTKRRYLDIYTNTAEARHSHALRFGRENEGVDGAAYVLHTENINDFVVSSGSFKSSGVYGKTIPIRKTTQAVLIYEAGDGENYLNFYIMIRGSTRYISADFYSLQRGNIYWSDDTLTFDGSSISANRDYYYVLIG